MIPLMNDTKWDEIREAMLDSDRTIRWRTKDNENGYIAHWDADWFYHFRQGRYKTIEWLEISLTEENIAYVMTKLKEIHVPGEVDGNVARVYGYKEGFVNYI
ncbi:hypothetical protein EV294_1115 [Paenibacillus sp. BK033]|uniref:DUF6678 family protein n=1 Tax=Paenibacillus sp. BK033 TaxID=2512133 RepID=UPI001053EA7E|nr:DUF6678 family protein [Paenibacillus sp. BK033]TCM89718.1 hypothetical protein EV294_1115 [Paenibacillus sp. BK033]